jgi:hypothetical protein
VRRCCGIYFEKPWNRTFGRKGVRDGVKRGYDNGETDQKGTQELGDCGRMRKPTTPGDHPVDNRQTCLPAIRTARCGSVHGFDLEDWISAEQELLQDDFSRDTSQFDCFIESPRNPEMTTILSVTTHSMIAFRGRALRAGEVDLGSDVASVHVFPDEIDATQVKVNRVGWLLHVHAPKKNHRNAS